MQLVFHRQRNCTMTKLHGWQDWCKDTDELNWHLISELTHTVQRNQNDSMPDCWQVRHGHQQHTWIHCTQQHQHHLVALSSVNTASTCWYVGRSTPLSAGKNCHRALRQHITWHNSHEVSINSMSLTLLVEVIRTLNTNLEVIKHTQKIVYKTTWRCSTQFVKLSSVVIVCVKRRSMMSADQLRPHQQYLRDGED